jgi:hypothetical protein
MLLKMLRTSLGQIQNSWSSATHALALSRLSAMHFTRPTPIRALATSTDKAHVHFPSDAEPWYALSRRGPVFILRMQRADNRFDFESTAALHKALDHVEQTVQEEDPKRTQPWALVTTGIDRIYSNGLDPEKVFSKMDEFCGQLFHPLLKRVLTFPMPTVAAMNGHAFAGGCVSMRAVRSCV